MAEAEPPAAEVQADEDEDEDEDEDDARSKLARSKGTIPTVGKQPDARVTRITRYNVFCPTCAPEEEVVPVPTPLPGSETQPLEFPNAVPSQLPLALVATMEAEDPGISLATISQTEGGITGVFAEGDEVLSNVTLLTVDLGIVYLRTASRVEYLQLSAEQPPPRPKAKEADEDEKEKSKTASKYELEGAADAIKCTGMSCTVERKFVQQILANPAMLATQGAARPYSRDGLSGFRLSRVRKGTVPRMLGLRTGDLITGINGQPLDSLDGAMKLYAKMRNASHLTVDMVRNKSGTRHEMRLDIQII